MMLPLYWRKFQWLSENRAVICLAFVHCALLIFLAHYNSFTWTEVGLLPSGLINWKYRDYTYFRVNPPLLRMWCTIPLVACDVTVPYLGNGLDVRERLEWKSGAQFIAQHGQTSLQNLFLARLMAIPLAVCAGWVSSVWARQLFGKLAGHAAGIAFATSPLLLSFNPLISGDGQCASAWLLTMYGFACWLRAPTFRLALGIGLLLGLSLSLKFTSLILVVLLPIVWLAARIAESHTGSTINIAKLAFEGLILICILTTGILIVNASYGFSECLRPLGEFGYISRSLSGGENWKQDQEEQFTFSDSMFRHIPAPFPAEYIRGLDLQKWDMDRERWSYFCGVWSKKGWYTYYVLGLLIKTPICHIMLLAISIIAFVSNSRYRATLSDEFCLILPILAILITASLETGLNRHLRYVLPAYPLVIVWATRIFAGSRNIARSSFVLLLGGATSSLAVFPHCFAYSNEVAGGPSQTARYLNASNLDWGQDLRLIMEWSERSATGPRLYISYWAHPVDLEAMGIKNMGGVPGRQEDVVRPAWLVIDQETLLSRPDALLYIRNRSPDVRIGYSFLAFHLE